VRERHGQRAETSRHGTPGGQDLDGLQQLRIVRVVGQGFRHVGEVPDALERGGIGLEVTVEQPGVLTRPSQLGEAAAERRQETEFQEGATYRIIRLRTP
jgi:hypothetical protein